MTHDHTYWLVRDVDHEPWRLYGRPLDADLPEPPAGGNVGEVDGDEARRLAEQNRNPNLAGLDLRPCPCRGCTIVDALTVEAHLAGAPDSVEVYLPDVFAQPGLDATFALPGGPP